MMNSTPRNNIIVDLSNIVWMLYHAEYSKNGNRHDAFLQSFLIQEVLKYISACALRFNAEGILIACDQSVSWRKSIYPAYKANRQIEKVLHFEEVMETMNLLKTFFNTVTDIPAIAVDGAEADDVIAVACKASRTPVVIISGDKDFIQLLRPNKVRLYAPAQKEERTSDNVALDLFIKCIRGDAGDNIESAFPRVYEKRLRKAWDDQLEMMNIMETVLPDGRKVADLYHRNQRLIDLSFIPSTIQDKIVAALEGVRAAPNRYNYLAFLKQLAGFNLKELAKSVDTTVFTKRFTG